MTLFVAVSSTYTTVQIALFENDRLIQSTQEHKFDASKKLIVALDIILKNNAIDLSDLAFIGVNQGPGPFTTLRTVIACANGISFASGIPLIGINSLDGLLEEYQDSHYFNTICLLNAFGHDVYWATKNTFGCNTITIVLNELKERYPEQPVRFLGNGVSLHQQTIKQIFGSYAVIPDPLPEHCSVEQIGKMALQKWHNKKDLSHQLLPIYLKEQQFTK